MMAADKSPLQLTNRELNAEVTGLALRVARQETTQRDVSLVHALSARLIGAVVALERVSAAEAA